MTNDEVVHQSAALRGQGRNQEALTLIEDHLPNASSDTLVNVLREGFLASRGAGLNDKARHYAKLVEAEEPGLPSVQSFLG